MILSRMVILFKAEKIQYSLLACECANIKMCVHECIYMCLCLSERICMSMLICAFSRTRSLSSSSLNIFHISILPSENVASLKQFPLSHYLMGKNRFPLAGAVDTRAGQELAVKRGTGSLPSSSLLGPDSPHRAGHWGRTVGPTGHRGV